MIRCAALPAALAAALALACASGGGHPDSATAAQGPDPAGGLDAPVTPATPAAALPAVTTSPQVPAAVPVAFDALPDGTAPRPFSAEQIAAHFPVGSWNHYRIETAGQPTVQQRSEVTAWSPERVSMQQHLLDDAGQPLGPARPLDAAWSELREHAAFPAEATTLERVPLSLDCGSFACQRYTIRGEQDGVPLVSTFWFATSKPGPPVLYTVDTAGQRSMTMTLLDWSPR